MSTPTSDRPVHRIRRARADEDERIMAIWRDAVDATHHFLSAADRAAIEGEVAGFLPAAPLWLAVDADDRPLGLSLLEGGRMEALFVDPAAHGRGVGRALVDHALALHPALGVDVNEQNDAALGFYRRMGFVVAGRADGDGQGRAYPLLHLHRRP